jgi:hypothetical protein
LHHEIDEGEELLELTEFVSGFGLLLDVEPTFTDVFELVFDDLAKSANPSRVLCIDAGVSELLNRIVLEILELFD